MRSYCSGNVRASPERRPSDRNLASVGESFGGPKIAWRAILSADDRYFSISAGESDSTSPMLSKP